MLFLIKNVLYLLHSKNSSKNKNWVNSENEEGKESIGCSNATLPHGKKAEVRVSYFGGRCLSFPSVRVVTMQSCRTNLA